jgi:hypothetical protein
VSALRSLQPAHLRVAGQQAHLADCRRVQLPQTLRLGQPHLDELGVETLEVRKHEQLLYRCVVANVAL